MLKLDNNLLDELGLGGLPADQKQAMLQHIYDTLELQVGTRLANQMTDQQLDEFERFIDSGGDANQAQALQWLESNLPNYKEVVNQVFEELKAEIKQMAPQIMATSVPAPQQPAVGQPQQAVPPTQMRQQAPAAPAPQVSPVSQPDPASYPAPSQPSRRPAQPQQPDPAQRQQGTGDAQIHQFPAQQPPAGPGGYRDRDAA